MYIFFILPYKIYKNAFGNEVIFTFYTQTEIQNMNILSCKAATLMLLYKHQWVAEWMNITLKTFNNEMEQ